MVKLVRFPALICLAFCAALCSADQLVTVPTAGKVPFGKVRLSSYAGFSNGYADCSADFGIGTSFETTIRGFRPAGGAFVGSLDLAYNYVSPIAGLVPGISLGVQDANDHTPDGRRFYFAFTSKQLFSTDEGDFPGDVTIGAYVGKRSSAFVGLNIPLSSYLRLIAEHNGYRLNAGFEVDAVKALGIRFIAVDGRPTVGFTTVTRF